MAVIVPAPARVRPLTLAFNTVELETAFRAEHRRKTLPALRLGLMLCCVLYGGFGVLDGSIIPDVAQTARLIRYALICPLALIGLGLSFVRRFDRWMSALAGALGLSAGLGIVGMIVLAAPPGSHLYYAGLLLVCMAIYTLFQLQFVDAVRLAWTMVAAYEIAAIAAATPTTILINNTFFLVGINVIGMIACDSTERVLRAAFLDQRIIEALAREDSLTGLYNRRAFFALAEAALAGCRARHAPVSVLMLDIDRFKGINDEHGHAVGDRVLRSVADSILANLRPGDTVCRYGGEEFLVLLPATPAAAAGEVGERLRAAVAHRLVNTNSTSVRVTASVGIATSAPHESGTLDSLIVAADGAMYAAKRGGRNLVALA